MYRPLSPEVIATVAAAGFDVYMRQPGESWMIFTDGKNLGYLQNGAFGGYDLSTVHVPNHESGTGYRMEDGLDLADLTPDRLRMAFTTRPHWASDRNIPRKFDGIDAYRASSNFHRSYKLQAKAAA